MPHLSSLEGDEYTGFALNVGTPVSPIVGNTQCGGAVYDDSTGKALYAVYDDSKVRCFRTDGDAVTLGTMDDSVSALSVIVNTAMSGPHSACLTVIDGTVYATVTGVNATEDWAGTRIYRDTGGGGTGPWVLHADLDTVTPSSADNPSAGAINGHRFGSEIWVLPSERWIISAAWANVVGVDGVQKVKFDMVNLYSDDDGVNWSPSVYVNQGGIGFDISSENGKPKYRCVSIDAGPRSFGMFDGKVYFGIANNTGSELNFYTTTGADWTRYVKGFGGGNGVYGFPFSVGEEIWRTSGTTNDVLSYTEAAPETNPSYTGSYDMGFTTSQYTQPMVCNIGSDLSPRAVGTSFGKVTPIGLVPGQGWTVGYIGMSTGLDMPPVDVD